MKCFLIAFIFIFSLEASAQLAVKVVNLRPTGYQGFLMKPSFSGEIMFIPDFEKRFRFRAGLSYNSLKPRLDTIPQIIYKYHYGFSVLPGYLTYSKYNLYFLAAGMDFDIINNEKFFLYPGIDILMGGISMDYEKVYETLITLGYSGGEVLGGLRFRFGAAINLSEVFNVFIEASQSGYLVDETGVFTHRDIGVGIKVDFRN